MGLYYCLMMQNQPMELPLDKNLYLGRSDANNIVVNDTRASRRHAELYFDGSAFVLNDLDSSNGTMVNDQPISCKVLADGDVIQIGMAAYPFRAVSDPAELEAEQNRLRMDTEGGMTIDMQLQHTGDLNGSLASMPITEVCQTLGVGQRTGLLRIHGSGQGTASLYFENGHIQNARHGDLAGDEAARAILRLTEGTFSFTADAAKVDANVTISTPRLLLETAKNG